MMGAVWAISSCERSSRSTTYWLCAHKVGEKPSQLKGNA
jgi:hypothetical protein